MQIVVHSRFVFQLCFLFAGSMLLGQDLLTAPPDGPYFELSTPRQEADSFGRSGISVEYTRSRPGQQGINAGGISIGVRDSTGTKQVIGGWMANEPTGKIRLGSFFGGNNIADLEIYLVMNVNWAENLQRQCLVSNTVRIGSPSGATSARAWNAEETAAYEKDKLGRTPPKNLPDGFVEVDNSTKLIPGVPVMVARYGEWKKGEVIALPSPTNATVHLIGTTRNLKIERKGWLAITENTLHLVESSPEQFTTKIRVTENGLLEIPQNAVSLPNSLELEEGVPVLVERGSEWIKAYVTDPSAIHLVSKEHGVLPSWPYKRGDLAIENETIAQLKVPGSLAKFKAEAKSLVKPENGPSDGAWGSSSKVGDYPIRIGLPPKSRVLPDDLKLEKGTVLAACWGSKWYEVYAHEANDDGTVFIKWKDFSSPAWDCSLKREQLIIQDKTIRALKNSTKPKLGSDADEETSGENSEGLDTSKSRIWSDKTGTFKINATFSRMDGDSVVLVKEDGKELKVKLEKLSQADQDLINSVPKDIENPFAQ